VAAPVAAALNIREISTSGGSDGGRRRFVVAQLSMLVRRRRRCRQVRFSSLSLHTDGVNSGGGGDGGPDGPGGPGGGGGGDFSVSHFPYKVHKEKLGSSRFCTGPRLVFIHNY